MLSMSFSLGMQHDSAIAWGERAYESTPDDQYTIATLAHAYAHAGRTDDARALLHRLEAQEHPSVYLRAMVHAALRDPEPMFALLEQAFTERDDAMADLPGDPSFAEYREDARMRDLVRRILTGP
jgi:pentatricopeptide repeat protein